MSTAFRRRQRAACALAVTAGALFAGALPGNDGAFGVAAFLCMVGAWALGCWGGLNGG